MNNPFDFSQFFKQNNPQDMLQQMQSQFQSQMQTAMQSAMNAFNPPQTPNIDWSKLTDAQQKNFEALLESQQKSLAFTQDLLSKQAELVQGAIHQAAEAGKKIAENLNDPQEIAKQQGELMQAVVDKALQSASEMGEMVSKAQEEVGTIIAERVQASMDEIKKSAS